MARPAKFIWLLMQGEPPPLPGMLPQLFPDLGTGPLSDCNTIKSFGFQYFSSSSLFRILQASVRCMLITSNNRIIMNTRNMLRCLMLSNKAYAKAIDKFLLEFQDLHL